MAKGAAKPLTKSDIVNEIVKATEIAKKDVRTVIETFIAVGHRELKKKGIFLIPGFSKGVVVKKPATKERKGINPFTKEPMIIKAKPARKVLRFRPIKAAKDALQ